VDYTGSQKPSKKNKRCNSKQGFDSDLEHLETEVWQQEQEKELEMQV
jgi:hypothetical protein